MAFKNKETVKEKNDAYSNLGIKACQVKMYQKCEVDHNKYYCMMVGVSPPYPQTRKNQYPPELGLGRGSH